MNNFLKQQEQAQLSSIRKTLVNIELLDMQERPVDRIEGEVLSGSLSIDGDSSVRRTCSLVLLTNNKNYKVLETSNPISINKKISVSIGIQDLLNKEMKEPIWINLGIFVLCQCTSVASVNSREINITALDKMCLHNGEVAGALEFTTRLDSENSENYISFVKNISENFKKLKDDFSKKEYIDFIIEDLEQLYINFTENNFITASSIFSLIEIMKSLKTATREDFLKKEKDISEEISRLNVETRRHKLTIREIIKYAAIELAEELPTKVIINDVPDKIKMPITLPTGEIGYKMVKYIYPNELTLNTGEPVSTVYEKCKEALGGNYEYFYDCKGNFIFQEIKNYKNNTIPPLEDLKVSNYKYDFQKMPIQFDFSEYDIETSYSVTPNWNNIKNDFYVWGRNEENLIGYHTVIDDKPIIPSYVVDLTQNNKKMDWREFLIHDYDIGQDNYFTGKCLEKDLNLMPHPVKNSTCCVIKSDKKIHYYIYTDNWTELDLTKVRRALKPSPYYKELSTLWKNDHYNIDFSKKIKNNYTYNFDIIDGDNALSKFSVKTIGRRKKPIEDESIKQLYPTIIEEKLVYYDDSDLKYTSRPENSIKLDRIEDFQKYPSAGNIYKDAFSTIRFLLYNNTTYNEQVQITGLPIYTLDVNRRCYVYFRQTNTNGYFLIKKIDYDFSADGSMTVSLIKTDQPERIVKQQEYENAVLTQSNEPIMTENKLNYIKLQ